MILEQSTAATISNYYGLGADDILIRFEPGGHNYFFYQDHEGSVTHVRNQANALVESYRYDVFGQPTVYGPGGAVWAQSSINNRFMFTGREWNQAFGFYEYRARAYHPGLGRFMSEDPKGFAAGDFNLFRYCGNDPEDRTDPTGLADNRINQDTNAAENSSGALQSPNWPPKTSDTLQLLGYGAVRIGMHAAWVDEKRQKVPSDGDRPVRFRILDKQTKDFGAYKNYEYQAETADGKTSYTSGYEAKEKTKLLFHDWNVRTSDRDWNPLKRGKWGDQVGFPPGTPRPKERGLDLREQRFSVRHIGDKGEGTPMETILLHVTISQGNGVIANGVYDVTPGH